MFHAHNLLADPLELHTFERSIIASPGQCFGVKKNGDHFAGFPEAHGTPFSG
jgi:hypothetical protein